MIAIKSNIYSFIPPLIPPSSFYTQLMLCGCSYIRCCVVLYWCGCSYIRCCVVLCWCGCSYIRCCVVLCWCGCSYIRCCVVRQIGVAFGVAVAITVVVWHCRLVWLLVQPLCYVARHIGVAVPTSVAVWYCRLVWLFIYPLLWSTVYCCGCSYISGCVVL